MTEKLTQDECVKALNGLYFSDRSDDRDDEFYNVLMELINERFDNPPLSFEEMKEGDWIWDNLHKTYIHIFTFDIVYDSVKFGLSSSIQIIIETDNDYVVFEPNRFYRKQVKK